MILANDILFKLSNSRKGHGSSLDDEFMKAIEGVSLDRRNITHCMTSPNHIPSMNRRN